MNYRRLTLLVSELPRLARAAVVHPRGGEDPRFWTLRFRAVDKKNFDELRRRLKTVETRAATERYRNIKTGDMLRIVCGKAVLEKKVRRVRRFKSIASLAKAISYKRINPSAGSIAEVIKMYHGYPSYKEKIKKFGIVAMEL